MTPASRLDCPLPMSRRIGFRALTLGVMLGALTLLSGCASPWRGPPSPHFDGTRFSNLGHPKSSSVGGYLWLRLTTPMAQWPEQVPVPATPAPPARISGDSARVTLIGHATLLIQVGGLNVLTDPVWSDRASPLSFAGPRRVSAPALSLQELPPIDLVLISHDHYDHLDLTTLGQLNAMHAPRVIVPLGVADLVRGAMPRSEVTEHDWGAQVPMRDALVTLEPMLHGSGRTPFDQGRRLWASFVLEAAGFKLLFVGDSGYGDGQTFRAIGERHAGFGLAILPIGAYEPVSFMADSHMTPGEAVKAAKDLRARRSMAHHFETFQLGFESHGAPRAALSEALRNARMTEEDFVAPRPGEFLQLSR